MPWAEGKRKPPFFHIPFKPYPLESGAPRGRSKGLDEFYDLNDTMIDSMLRSPRKYNMRDNMKPARPKSAELGSAGPLGPGSYTLDRSFMRGRPVDRGRPSAWARRDTGGKFKNVGLSYAEYLGVDLSKLPEPGMGSVERRRGAEPKRTH